MYGIEVLENDFIPLVENIYRDCSDMIDIDNDEKLMIYEVNSFEIHHLLQLYENEQELKYVTFI